MTGADFKQIRQHLGLTQRELADRMGYSRRETIAKIESYPVVPTHVEAHIKEIRTLEQSAKG